jgi:hypothetical protein
VTLAIAWMRRASLAVSAASLVMILGVAARPASHVNDAAILQDGYAPALSEYGFFADLKARTPATRVTPYHLNTPLFSDYAEKQRFLYVPAGKKATYTPSAALDFPVGSALIKTFGYEQGGAFKPLETRLLLHRAEGWVAVPYVWNADAR